MQNAELARIRALMICETETCYKPSFQTPKYASNNYRCPCRPLLPSSFSLILWPIILCNPAFRSLCRLDDQHVVVCGPAERGIVPADDSVPCHLAPNARLKQQSVQTPAEVSGSA